MSKRRAETTTKSGRLVSIGQYSVGPLRYLRFNYTTGDAAGQNMTGKAHRPPASGSRANYPGQPRFILSGSIDTDKKHSQINMLLTRGKRVVAEAVIPDALLQSVMGVDSETLFRNRQISMTGSYLAGAASNGAHAANGLAARPSPRQPLHLLSQTRRPHRQWPHLRRVRRGHEAASPLDRNRRASRRRQPWSPRAA